jgi:hypothetical protein
MNAVVELFPKGPDLHHVLIEAGTISGPSDHPHLGQLRYFVSVVDADGGDPNVWDGSTHQAAIAEAGGWRLGVAHCRQRCKRWGR